MAEKFVVQILTDKEFDSLPYRGISDSMGIADPHKNLAFVRSSGVKEIDLATLHHEVQHLIEKNGEHADEDGIMHKKGGVMRFLVPAALALIPGVGPALAAASNIGMSQYAQSRHPEQLGKPGNIGNILMQGATGYFGGKALASGVSGAIAGGSQAAPGFLSKAGGIIKGAAVGTPAGVGGPATTTAGISVPSTFIPSTGGILGSGGGLLGTGGSAASKAAQAAWSNPVSNIAAVGGPSAALGITPSLNSAIPGNTGNLANAAKEAVTNQIPKVVTDAASSGFSFKDLTLPTNILGASSLLGAAATPTPQFQMPDSVEQLRSKLQSGQGLSPLGQQAQSELKNILGSKPSELYPTASNEFYNSALRRTRESYSEAEKQLDAAYNNAGMYGSGEHMAQKAKLKEELARTESGLYAQTEQRNFELARTAKYQAVQDALGVDKNIMDDLVGLTGLDVQTAAMLYGAKVADVQSIRESLGTLGTELLMRGKSQNASNNILGGVSNG